MSLRNHNLARSSFVSLHVSLSCASLSPSLASSLYIEKAFGWFLFRLSQNPTFAQLQPFIIISNWCQLLLTRRFFAYLKGPHFSPSHSPISPAFSKKPSRPLAWMPRTFLRIVSDMVAPHTHVMISQGFLTTSSSCTGTYKLYLSLPLATRTRVADVMATSLFNTV